MGLSRRFAGGHTMDDIDLLGGRKTLPQLVASKQLPYNDVKQAREFLDRLGVPFVRVRRRRFYRPASIAEALDRHEQRQLEETAA
jgi:hypothetical protein